MIIHSPTCNSILNPPAVCNCVASRFICSECQTKGPQPQGVISKHSHIQCTYYLGEIKVDTYTSLVAIRDSQLIRYDILDPLFLEMLAKIADYGAKKYGDLNWQKSRLSGDKGPINHIYKHLKSYRTKEPYDHLELGEGHEWHLAAIAFNAMMEFYYSLKEKESELS
jgi:dATP/dGTP diphosphohydrolase